MKDIIIISGGMSYNSYDEYINTLQTFQPRMKEGYTDWKVNLKNELMGFYQTFIPLMPCRDNAKYSEWKIVFEKVLELSQSKDILLIGHSLGANFIQTYLGETKISKNIFEIHFVAGTIKEGDFRECQDWNAMSDSCGHIHIWHSVDDPYVPLSDSQYYHNKLPDSHLHVLNGRGHINQPYFPELSAHLINLRL